MIKFHKIKNRPTKVDKGDEVISFRYSGQIYITDNDGNHRLMTAGTRSGVEIPTWTPEEPNALYYSTKEKKHYISTVDKWIEIPQKVGGSTGGPTTTAGNVIVNDLGDNFTSNDVEGALSEIADKIPGFKDGIIKDYSGDAKGITGTNEYFLTQHSTNRPKTSLGWSITRKGSNGNTYGYYADDKSAYHYYNGVYTELATKDALTALANSIGQNVEDEFEKILEKTISVKDGIVSNGRSYFDGLEIGLSQDLLDKINNAGSKDDGIFLKKEGDTSTGNIYIGTPVSKSNDAIIGLKDDSGVTALTIYLNRTTGNGGLFNAKKNDAVLRTGLDTGKTQLQSLANGMLELRSLGNGVDILAKDRTYIKRNGNNTILHLQADSGGILLGSASDTAYIEAYSGTNYKAPRDLMIRGGGRTTLKQVSVLAGFTYARHSLVAGSSMHVGMDPATEYGHTGYNDMINSLLCIHPYERNSEWGANRNYARLAYSQANNVLRVQSYRKNTGNKNYVDRTNSIGVSASWFSSTSSIEYKDVEGELSPREAFNEVLATTPYTYTFKDDHRENKEVKAGFIIEKGMPEITITDNRKSVDTYGLIAYMYGAFQHYVKTTDEKIDKLQAQLDAR